MVFCRCQNKKAFFLIVNFQIRSQYVVLMDNSHKDVLILQSWLSWSHISFRGRPLCPLRTIKNWKELNARLELYSVHWNLKGNSCCLLSDFLSTSMVYIVSFIKFLIWFKKIKGNHQIYHTKRIQLNMIYMVSL